MNRQSLASLELCLETELLGGVSDTSSPKSGDFSLSEWHHSDLSAIQPIIFTSVNISSHQSLIKLAGEFKHCWKREQDREHLPEFHCLGKPNSTLHSETLWRKQTDPYQSNVWQNTDLFFSSSSATSQLPDKCTSNRDLLPTERREQPIWWWRQ